MKNTALIFPGQGSQFIGMGKELAEAFPIAKDTLQEVDETLGFHLSKLMFSGDLEDLTLTVNAQPAIMAVSIAAMRVLCHQLNVDNGAAIASLAAGHSLGEYSALCASSALSLSQTTRLLKIRGESMQDAVPFGQGAMLALLNAEEEAATGLAKAASAKGICEVANDNGAGQFVLSGSVEAIDYALEIHKDYGIKRAIKLNVSAPFHSSMMKKAADKMEQALQEQEVSSLSLPIIANFTAKINNDSESVKQLLVQQVCGKVRWRESMDHMWESGINTFIEVGPGKVLTTLAKRMYADCIVYNIHSPAELDSYCNSI